MTNMNQYVDGLVDPLANQLRILDVQSRDRDGAGQLAEKLIAGIQGELLAALTEVADQMQRAERAQVIAEILTIADQKQAASVSGLTEGVATLRDVARRLEVSR